MSRVLRNYEDFEMILKVKEPILKNKLSQLNAFLEINNYFFMPGLGGMTEGESYRNIFPKWQSFIEAEKDIFSSQNLKDFDICYQEKREGTKLNISFDYEHLMFSSGINEGYFIDVAEDKESVNPLKLSMFVRFFESLSLKMQVTQWLMHPNTASCDELQNYRFVPYQGGIYPAKEIESTIDWYENVFFKRST